MTSFCWCDVNNLTAGATEQCDEGDDEAGQDHVEDVEERLASDLDLEGDVRIGLGTAAVSKKHSHILCRCLRKYFELHLK